MKTLLLIIFILSIFGAIHTEPMTKGRKIVLSIFLLSALLSGTLFFYILL